MYHNLQRRVMDTFPNGVQLLAVPFMVRRAHHERILIGTSAHSSRRWETLRSCGLTGLTAVVDGPVLSKVEGPVLSHAEGLGSKETYMTLH